ncbi:unnamed protein product [Dibothriocephalus latus]|uniref:Uncharacterized protein n=1 Tax=Dibothriocephalus latus TaxID=60516 RepID=A0A3P7NHF8_DIBLA|nr:unnamed protein product [Dibothriocephalus latus]
MPFMPQQVDYTRSGWKYNLATNSAVTSPAPPTFQHMGTLDGLIIFLSNMQKDLHELKAKMAVIEAKLESALKNLSTAPLSMPPAQTECPVPSPMKSMEEFDAFEERLLDTNYWQQAVAFLRTRGGWRARDFKGLMKPLFNGRYGRQNFQPTRA